MPEKLLLVSAGAKTFLGKLKEDGTDFIILKDTMNFLEFNMPTPQGEIRSISVPISILNTLPEVTVFPNSIIEVTEDMELYKTYASEVSRINSGLIITTVSLLNG